MANYFWVGGSGTWDLATATHWASASGGTGGFGVPSSFPDNVTIDGNSGGGTITVASTTGLITFNTMTYNSSTTLSFSANNNNVNCDNVSVNGGSGTFNMGSGTWNHFGSFGGLNFTAGPTIVASNVTWAFVSAAPSNIRTLGLAGATVGTVTAVATPTKFARLEIDGGTVNTLTVTGANNLYFGANLTVATAFNMQGQGSSAAVCLFTLDANPRTLTLSGTSSMNWCASGGVTYTGSPIANNSFDMGGNSGITINGPSGSTGSGGGGGFFGS